MREVWAVFNLDTDLENYQFMVDLGGTVTGDPEPGSTTITLHARGVEIPCLVFVQPERAGRVIRTGSLPRGKLEILSSIDRDGLAEVAVAQLSLALRLFKASPFWIVSWDRRNDFRVWSQPEERYILRSEELTAFRKLSTMLGAFHVDRNIYWYYRLGYPPLDLLGGSQLDILDPSDPTGEKFLTTNAYLMVATDFFEQAQRDWRLSKDLRLILLMMAVEALFADDEKAELSYRISHRIATLNGASGTERKAIFEVTRRLYDIRSRLVHGSLYRKSRRFLQVDWSDLLSLTNLLRSSLLYFIALSDLGKARILSTLDLATFDEREALILRIKSNRFWGFGESPDEHLYTIAWGVSKRARE